MANVDGFGYYSWPGFASLLAGLGSVGIFATAMGRGTWAGTLPIAVGCYALSLVVGWWGYRKEPYRAARTRRVIVNTVGYGLLGFLVCVVLTQLGIVDW